MLIFAQIIGLLAVALFLISYQQKKRKRIIACNAMSRILYILQYVMLSAFEGAVLDVLGTISSLMAHNKGKGIIKKHTRLMFIIINLIFVAAGVLLYKNIFSICALIGVMLHTIAFWITDERIIRRVSFLGSPFWLIFNLTNAAYGSAVGDFLSMLSIGIAIYRYDIKGAKRNV